MSRPLRRPLLSILITLVVGLTTALSVGTPANASALSGSGAQRCTDPDSAVQMCVHLHWWHHPDAWLYENLKGWASIDSSNQNIHLIIDWMQVQGYRLDYTTMTWHWVRIVGSPDDKDGYGHVAKYVGPVNCANRDEYYRVVAHFRYWIPKPTSEWFSKTLRGPRKSSSDWRCTTGGVGK
jgi:hypothetical protein